MFLINLAVCQFFGVSYCSHVLSVNGIFNLWPKMLTLPSYFINPLTPVPPVTACDEPFDQNWHHLYSTSA